MRQYKDRVWAGFLIIFFCYAAAAGLGAFVYLYMNGDVWFKLLAADAAATLFVWAVSLVFRNASVYDPYWSVQPVIILALLLLQKNSVDTGSVLLFAVILFWGVRLTANWAYTFKGLGHQDWRYSRIKEQTGKFYQIVNLIGIQLMPTFIVYLCVLPAVYYIVQESVFSAFSVIGLAVSISGTVLQMTADMQMHKFQKSGGDRTKIIRTGVWKHSRHPNYLGEIMMWWGVYLAMLPGRTELWYLFAGALMNTLLFLFISIPLAEKHLAGYKVGYAEYQKETRMLLPLPRKS
ncbi:MAG TPA: DUF1295 domain-containing protein [Oscillospiraceae bacterium]|nr:DUF1295 domain-containing protein [Oscillospiraceae bacterium]